MSSLWVQRFGHLRTLEFPQHTAALNDHLRQWRETHSASACNHRRDALTNLVKVLYGRRAAADFVDLVRFAPPPPRPRWLERTHIADGLEHLTPGSKSVVRLRLMHWTGVRSSQIRHAFATGLRRTGSDVADIQDLYGHTDPETTMIYAPPQLQKHADAIARLERADRVQTPVPHGKRLAETAGSLRGSSVSY